jgi:hypothetical protein
MHYQRFSYTIVIYVWICKGSNLAPLRDIGITRHRGFWKQASRRKYKIHPSLQLKTSNKLHQYPSKLFFTHAGKTTFAFVYALILAWIEESLLLELGSQWSILRIFNNCSKPDLKLSIPVGAKRDTYGINSNSEFSRLPMSKSEVYSPSVKSKNPSSWFQM